MKKSRVKAQKSSPEQSSLFAEPTEPLTIAPAVIEEVRSAIAELLLEAVRPSGREAVDECEAQ